jgi:hypothetical protein
LQGEQEILSKLPPAKTIWKLNLVGNDHIRDAGMNSLHLLPHTVTDLDLSECGLTAIGCKLVCEMLKTTQSITRMIMWGNNIGEEGAKHVGDMLKVNTTIRELCIMDCGISPVGFSYLSEALKHNTTLRDLSLANSSAVGDEHVKMLCPGLKLNKGLEILDLKSSKVTDKGVEHLVEVAKHNYFLKYVKLSQSWDDDAVTTGFGTPWNTLSIYLGLNRLNRKLILNEDGTTDSDWTEALIRSAEDCNLHAIFFFLRNKPDLCAKADVVGR